MARGILVKRQTDSISGADGVLFGIGGPELSMPRRARLLKSLAPSARVARLDRDNAVGYQEFRVQYWRELGTRSNVADLARLRYLGRRSPGVTLLRGEPVGKWSAAAAVAERSRASTQGDDPSSPRPRGPTMRSIRCRIGPSLSIADPAPSRAPRSTNTSSGSVDHHLSHLH